MASLLETFSSFHSMKSSLLEDDCSSPDRRGRALSAAEAEGIQAALEAVDKEGQQLQEQDGLSQMSFFLGVLNVPFLCLVLAWLPDYLWIAYCAETFFLIPAFYVNVRRIYNGALFLLDFCWVGSAFFAFYFLGLMFEVVPMGLREPLFLVFYASALGPLGWACIALHNGLIFHSAQKIASLFIHMSPTFVAWTIVYYPEKLADTWPGRFPNRDALQEIRLSEVYAYGFGAYFVWLVLHGAWLLTDGIHCPERGLNTVFADLYDKRNLAKMFEQRTGLRSLRSHAALYLMIHCFLCALCFVWSVLCFRFVVLHMVFGVVLFLSSAWAGAGYYEYVMARKYTKVVRKVLEDKRTKPDATPL
mmetsp:Transcript_71756/g.126668  ORF Transcript_71756/g.126668 Transcript_71756/m.126668 type:complete len:360 (-) Transcript_71756:60-1139(-)